MYCNNCGCKIRSGERRCPNCDTEIKDIEYNGGFWGLVGQAEKESFIPEIDSIESEFSKDVNKDICMDILDMRDDNTQVENDTDRSFEKLEIDKKSEKNKQSTKIKKTYTKRIILLSCVATLLLLLCVIQTIRAAFAVNRYKELKVKYDIVFQDYQSLVSNNMDLNQQLDEVNSKLDDLKDKESVTEETMSAEEKTVTDDPLSAEEKSVIEKVLSAVENSTIEETSSVEEKSVSEGSASAEEKTITEVLPSVEERSDIKKTLENKNVDYKELLV